MSRKNAKLLTQDAVDMWISPAQATKLLRDGLVEIVSRHPLTLMEKPRIKAIFSTRYLDDRRSEGLRLYREDLYKTLVHSREGNKPPHAHGERQHDLEESHIATPHGFGRDGD